MIRMFLLAGADLESRANNGTTPIPCTLHPGGATATLDSSEQRTPPYDTSCNSENPGRDTFHKRSGFIRRGERGPVSSSTNTLKLNIPLVASRRIHPAVGP